jgi:threonine dehydrogenase-like Zn-dependent dehydrogenase
MIAGARQKKSVVADRARRRRRQTRPVTQCGADLTIDIGAQDGVVAVKELTSGNVTDGYVDRTGHPSAVSQGLNLLRKLGTYVEYSVFGSDVTVVWSIISDDRELNVLGAFSARAVGPPRSR